MSPENFRGGLSGRERDLMYINPNGSDQFVNAAYGLNLDYDDDGRAVVPVDIDGDGDLDLVIMSLQNLHLAENRVAANTHFARVHLRARKTQHHALGANVTVHTAGIRQQDFVKASSGFQSQVPFDLHFGLGKATKIDRIEVRWPSGDTQRFENPPIDRLLRLTEGEALQSEKLKSWIPNALPPERVDYDLKSPVARVNSKAVPTLPLAVKGKPTLVNFWAPWCAPCLKELPVIQQLSQDFKEHMTFVGISVETEKLNEVREKIAEFKLEYDQALADHVLLESFFGTRAAAALPATFLFDEKGALVRAFLRPVDETDLRNLIESLLTEKPRVPYLLVLGESALRRQDYASAASYFEQALAVEPDNVFVLTQYGTILGIGGDLARSIETLERALKKDSTFHYAWAQLGLAYKRGKKFDQALSAYERALSINPENVSYLVQTSNLLIRLEKFKTAEERLLRVTKLEPKEFLAWLNLGKVRQALNKAGAHSAFERAVQINPEDLEAQRLYRESMKPTP